MIFKSFAGKLLPKADTQNEAGGKAYALPPKHALAQYAATGCLNSVYYSTAGEQLERILRFVPGYRAGIYRENG
jgi:60 kDa SS-A/Ro ribonucleoprotein